MNTIFGELGYHNYLETQIHSHKAVYTPCKAKLRGRNNGSPLSHSSVHPLALELHENSVDLSSIIYQSQTQGATFPLPAQANL